MPKTKFINLVSANSKRILEEVNQNYEKVTAEKETVDEDALKEYIVSYLAIYQLEKNNQPINEDSFNHKYNEIVIDAPDSISEIAEHYMGKGNELFDLLDYETAKVNDIYERCKNKDASPDYDQFKFMSNTEVALKELEYEDNIKICNEGEKKIADIAAPAQALIDEMNTLPEDKKNLAGFKKMKAALVNLSKFGTTEYKYKTKDGEIKNAPENDKLNPLLAVAAFNDILSAANDFYRENKPLCTKIMGEIWKKQKEHKQYLSIDSNSTKKKCERGLTLIGGEKAIRNMSEAKVTPQQDYVLRTTKAWDMVRDVRRQHEDGKLSWFRGSSQYKDVGTQLNSVFNDWQQMLNKEGEIQKSGQSRVNDQNELKQRVNGIISKLKTLKEKDKAYFDHKVTDGQFLKGTNKNADKRIAIVDNIDKFADYLLETMNRKLNIIDGKIAEMTQKNNEEVDQNLIIEGLPEVNDNKIINQPKDYIFMAPKKEENIKNNESEDDEELEININPKNEDDKNIDEEEELAIDISGKNKKNDDDELDDEDIKEEPEKENNKNDNNIIIEEEPKEIVKPKTDYEKAKEFLDKKRSDAQEELKKATENGAKLEKPVMNAHLAAITTASFAMSCISGSGNKEKNTLHISPSNMDENLYTTFLKNTVKSKSFKNMVNKTDEKTLYDQAVFDKGQNLYSNHQSFKALEKNSDLNKNKGSSSNLDKKTLDETRNSLGIK